MVSKPSNTSVTFCEATSPVKLSHKPFELSYNLNNNGKPKDILNISYFLAHKQLSFKGLLR